MKEKMSMEKKMKWLVSAVIVIAVISVAMSGVSLYYLHKTSITVDPPTQENGVVIADEYTIESTTKLSDAYKNNKVSSLDKDDQKTVEEAEKVLKEIIKDKMTNYEKEKSVYEWMCKNISNDTGAMSVIPNTSNECDRPSGVLVTHKAVCVGYATTFRFFMEMLDIPCHVVHNDSNYHSWDLVQLDNNWYHVDCYSDAGTANYTDFNLNDDAMAESNSWDQSYWPAATSLDYNINYMNRQSIDSVYDIPKEIRSNLNDKKTNMAFEFKSLSNDDATIASSLMDQLTTKLYNTEEYTNYTISYSFLSYENATILRVNITKDNNNNEEETSDISEKDQKKIDKAIEKAFGDLSSSDNYMEEDMK